MKPATVQYTPTPWYLNAVNGQSELFAKNEDGSTVCTAIVHGPSGEWGTVGPIHEANAAFIVRAVNCHEAFLKASKHIVLALETRFARTGCNAAEEIAMKELRDAIAKAEAR